MGFNSAFKGLINPQFHKVGVTESQDPEPELVQCTLDIHSIFV